MMPSERRWEMAAERGAKDLTNNNFDAHFPADVRQAGAGILTRSNQ
jgi:hypothetical protein